MLTVYQIKPYDYGSLQEIHKPKDVTLSTLT